MFLPPTSHRGILCESQHPSTLSIYLSTYTILEHTMPYYTAADISQFLEYLAGQLSKRDRFYHTLNFGFTIEQPITKIKNLHKQLFDLSLQW